MKLSIYPEHVMRDAMLPDAVVISIVSPGQEHPHITAKHLLQMHFHDVDKMFELQDGRIILPLSESQADTIARFVWEHKTEEFWVVHCEAGISRSPAVGLAIADFLGDRDMALFTEGRFSTYNRFVRSMVENALHKIEFERTSI